MSRVAPVKNTPGTVEYPAIFLRTIAGITHVVVKNYLEKQTKTYGTAREHEQTIGPRKDQA